MSAGASVYSENPFVTQAQEKRTMTAKMKGPRTMSLEFKNRHNSQNRQPNLRKAKKLQRKAAPKKVEGLILYPLDILELIKNSGALA